MNILHVLYLMFLLGSLAFGLEALLLGLGGQLSVLYRRNWKQVLKLASLIGLVVVSLSIATTTILGLGPLFLCALVLAYTLLSSRIVNLYKVRLVKSGSPPPLSPTADAEIKQILQKRGFSELVEEEKD